MKASPGAFKNNAPTVILLSVCGTTQGINFLAGGISFLISRKKDPLLKAWYDLNPSLFYYSCVERSRSLKTQRIHGCFRIYLVWKNAVYIHEICSDFCGVTEGFLQEPNAILLDKNCYICLKYVQISAEEPNGFYIILMSSCWWSFFSVFVK